MKLPPGASSYLDWPIKFEVTCKRSRPVPSPSLPPCICICICTSHLPRPPLSSTAQHNAFNLIRYSGQRHTPQLHSSTAQPTLLLFCPTRTLNLESGNNFPNPSGMSSILARHSLLPPAAGRSPDPRPTNPSTLPIAVARHRTSPPLTGFLLLHYRPPANIQFQHSIIIMPSMCCPLAMAAMAPLACPVSILALWETERLLSLCRVYIYLP